MMEAAGSSLNPEEVSTKNKKEKNEEHEKRRKDARNKLYDAEYKPKTGSCQLRSKIGF